MPGAWRSACQRAVSKRAKSASSVRMSTLALRKRARSLKFDTGGYRRRIPLQLFRFVESGKQTLGADAQIDGGFGVFGLLGNVDAFLQARDFDASHGECAVEVGSVAGFFCRLGGGGNHGAGDYGT